MKERYDEEAAAIRPCSRAHVSTAPRFQTLPMCSTSYGFGKSFRAVICCAR